ncbi:MAG: EF-hand domain-containing protein [Sphingomonas sp.]
MIILLLASAALAGELPSNAPIDVVGHAWAPFISPMGEPFRARTSSDDTLARWFNQADRNHDGLLTADEMQADADRYFAILDTDKDGEIGPEELINYEWELAPDIQVNSKLKRAPGEISAAKIDDSDKSDGGVRRRHGGEAEFMEAGLEGAARYGLLNMPEPVAAADADFNRSISRAEFRQAALARFALLDGMHRGKLTLQGLEGLRSTVLASLRQPKHRKSGLDSRIGAPLPPEQ